MWTILEIEHKEELKKEYKICCFDYGKVKGDIKITCKNDETILTQSEMLLTCSEYFIDYKKEFNSNELSLPYDKKIVIAVLQTFYGEPIEKFEEWSDLLNYFELAESLIPIKEVSECLEEVCNNLIKCIKKYSEYPLIEAFKKLSYVESEKIVKYLSTTDNKYIKKINEELWMVNYDPDNVKLSRFI